MNRHGVRYELEHGLLPEQFHKEKQNFVVSILHDRRCLFRIFDGFFKEEGLKNPYTEEDFKPDLNKITDNDYMLKITFPEPEEEPLCYCSYMFFDSDDFKDYINNDLLHFNLGKERILGYKNANL